MDNYDIIWSPIARLTYFDTLEYLQLNWPEQTLEDFINRTNEVLNLISKNPLLYAYSKEINVYKCVVVKQISLFYRIRITRQNC